MITASSTSWDWLNLPEKSRPAKTKTFLIHSFGRPVLIAARSGERRGAAAASSLDLPDSAGTVGCSEVIVPIMIGVRPVAPAAAIRESRQGTAAGA